MKNLILLLIITVGLTYAQTYRVEKLTGYAEFLNSNDKWIGLEKGTIISDNSLVVTEENSSVKISGDGIAFTLKGSSAIQVSNIKEMTIDELLLALAIEDILDAPRKKENGNGKSTAVYGEKEGTVQKTILADDFGIKRIKGAMQLGENGFKESAVVSAKEIFRKYPGTKKKAEYRIYFAELLYGFGLYEEAYEEFSLIKNLNLSEEEKIITEKMLSLLNKKIVNK